jgi:hypothetical protein
MSVEEIEGRVVSLYHFSICAQMGGSKGVDSKIKASFSRSSLMAFF